MGAQITYTLTQEHESIGSKNYDGRWRLSGLHFSIASKWQPTLSQPTFQWVHWGASHPPIESVEGGGLGKECCVTLLLNEESRGAGTTTFGDVDLALHYGIPNNYSVQQPWGHHHWILPITTGIDIQEADTFCRKMCQNQAVKFNWSTSLDVLKRPHVGLSRLS